MYVLIDLRTSGPDVEAWLGGLPGGPDGPRRIQRFNAIGYASLELTDAELKEASERKFRVEPVRDLRAPLTRAAGPGMAAVDFLRAVPKLWNLDQIGRSELAATGNSINVGHIDTGIAGKHPVLNGHPARFCTFKQNGDVVVMDPKAEPFDDADHGTETASLICGKSIGVAPNVLLHSAALLGRPWTDAMLVAALDWMIIEKVRVVWLGIERPAEFCDLHEQQMSRVLAAGVLPVTAVGNKGQHASSTPGNTACSLSVGAVGEGHPDPIMWQHSGSQVHPHAETLRPDLVGPGHDVHVATLVRGPMTIDYEVAPRSGTSLAGPHLVGLAALCLELRPAIDVTMLRDILRKSCEIYTLDPRRANRGVPWGELIRHALP